MLAYSLEAVIEDGLKLDWPMFSSEIDGAYRALDPAHPYLESKASSRIEHWHRWNQKERKSGFVELLESLDPMFESGYKFSLKRGAANFKSPAEWDAVDADSE